MLSPIRANNQSDVLSQVFVYYTGMFSLERKRKGWVSWNWETLITGRKNTIYIIYFFRFQRVAKGSIDILKISGFQRVFYFGTSRYMNTGVVLKFPLYFSLILLGPRQFIPVVPASLWSNRPSKHQPWCLFKMATRVWNISRSAAVIAAAS